LCFQAEDGIRADLVTGVQTCALPIYRRPLSLIIRCRKAIATLLSPCPWDHLPWLCLGCYADRRGRRFSPHKGRPTSSEPIGSGRSEERREGKAEKTVVGGWFKKRERR